MKNIRYRYHQEVSEQGKSAGEALDTLLQSFSLPTVLGFIVTLPTEDLDVMLLSTNNIDVEDTIFNELDKRQDEGDVIPEDTSSLQDLGIELGSYVEDNYDEGDWEREHSQNLYR